MRDLRVSLLQHDVALLRVIAEAWGCDVAGLGRREAADRLADLMLATDLAAELADLPPSEQTALQALQELAGRMLAAPFFRRFGEIRPFGPSSLARERPWLAPTGPAEALWYRGLLFRTFEQTEMGGQEFVYLPDDLRWQLPAPAAASSRPQLVALDDPAVRTVRHGWARGPQRSLAADLVDDCCTLLAYVQRHAIPMHPHPAVPGEELLPFLCYKERARLHMLWELVLDVGFLDLTGDEVRLQAKKARQWLQAPFPEQASVLVQAWLSSTRWNDLLHVSSLRAEPTSWQNDPRPPRQMMLEILADLDPTTWWRLDSLPAAVKSTTPDFQRTAGEYDSWYLRDAGSGEYLRGYQHWDRVEGALLFFLATGPLAWLGLVELGENEDGRTVAFRPTPTGRTFAQVRSFPYPPGPTQARIQVNADATIVVPASADRFTRFQVARLADWEPLAADFHYRLTPRSLAAARESGIDLSRALAFLASRSGQQLPEPVKRAVEGWAQDGVRVQLRQVTLLQVRDTAMLDKLRASPEVRPMLGEAIGSLAVAVRTRDLDRLVRAIARLGLLCEVETLPPEQI